MFFVVVIGYENGSKRKEKRTKRISKLILSLAMAFSLFANIGIAHAETLTGSMNDDGSVTYTYDPDTYELVISGTGAITKPLGQVDSTRIAYNDTKTINIQDGITAIGERAFAGMRSVQTVVISDTVKTIDKYAFVSCSNLESVKLGEGVESIGDNAFDYCESLTSINFPASLRTIGRNAFENDKIKTVEFAEGLESIGAFAFMGCNSLESLSLPSSLKQMGQNCFYWCSSLETVIFPEGLTAIPFCGFYGCTNLKSVNLPSTVVSIGQAAFAETSITSIVIPGSVKTIESGNFFKCNSLTEVTIQEGVTTIESVAFQDCYDLTSITIPESVTEIDDSAFKNDTNLTIYCHEGSYAEKYAEHMSIAYENCHFWNYSFDDHAILAECTHNGYTHEDCTSDCAGVIYSLPVEIESSYVYSGDEVEVAFGTADEQNAWVDAGRALPTVEYYQGETKLENSPRDAGDYTARVIIDGLAKDYAFTIEKSKELTVTAPADVSKGYDGEALSGAVTANLEGATVTYATKTSLTDAYGDAATEVPSLTDVGTLYVKATATKDSYDSAEVEYVLTVNKASLDYDSALTLYVYSSTKGSIELPALPEGWSYGTVTHNTTLKSAVLEGNILTCQLKYLLTKTGTVTIPVIGDDNHEAGTITVTVVKATPVSMSKCSVAVTQSQAGALVVAVTDANGKVVDPSCYKVTTTGTMKAGKTVYVKVTGITARGYSSSKTVKFKVEM